MEEWRDIKGYEGLYQVSNLGRVKRLPITQSRTFRAKNGLMKTVDQSWPGRILRPSKSLRYWGVHLSRNNEIVTRFVHHLVAEAFIGERPAGMHVCHADGDSTNNEASNLRYDTPINNAADKVKHGTVSRGERHGHTTLTNEQVKEIKKLVKEPKHNLTKIAKSYLVSRQTIANIRDDVTWKHI